MGLTSDTVHTLDDARILDLVVETAAGPTPSSNDEWLLVGQVVNQAMNRGLRVPVGVVETLLADPRRRQDALGLCVWCLERDDALAMVRPLLADPESRAMAAWALGCLADLESAGSLLSMLDDPGLDRSSGHVLTALSRLDTPAVRASLARRAATTGGDLWFVARGLRRLTGHAPLPPEGAGRDAWEEFVRAYWHSADPMVRPDPRVAWRLRDAGSADVEVEHGRDVFALEDEHPSRAGSWPLWFVAWTMGGRELWTVGSSCSTCEVYLARGGWAPQDAIDAAQVVREKVADVVALTPELLVALEPVLTGCATGRYALRLCDVRLGATGLDGSWYGVDGRGIDEDDEPMVVDPAVTVYAVPRPGGGVEAFTVVPTQPSEALDESRVAELAEDITRGARPAVLVAAHATDRLVMSSDDRVDRAVTSFVVDGHHKLAAYDRLGIPARLLLLCDLEPRIAPGVVDVAALFAEVLDGVVVPVGGGAGTGLGATARTTAGHED